MGLEDKRTLVVGASRGIGRAIAETFGHEGAAVALAARSESDLAEAAAGVDAETMITRCDLRDPESVQGAVRRTVDGFEGLDAVVNSAGTITRGEIVETGEEDMRRVVDVNLLGTMRLAREAMPALVNSGGAFVTISSEAAVRGIPNLPVYCASKGGVNSLTRQLAVAYADEGVTVNAIAPGTTKTSINEQVRSENPEWVDERAAGIPANRLGTPEDVAAVAAFVVSDAAEHVTGEVIAVDGGSTAQ